MVDDPTPFSNLAAAIPERSPLRRAITAATRRPEPDCLAPLLPLAEPTPEEAAATRVLAKKLVNGLRRRGAAGGVEAAVCLIALRDGLVPAGVNTTVRDPALRADYRLDNELRVLRHALSNSFGFGGANCSLVFAA